MKLLKTNKPMAQTIVCILLQFLFFIPIYFIWKNDCKKYGKDNLAMSLEERFLAWLIFCPIWVFGFLK